ncbi:hypothetical protein C8R44DRAFT_786672 [Mycena epipterygia]|nr:hypothetical protein C8R44DRAFT_786672 [Mycena epipterygia]
MESSPLPLELERHIFESSAHSHPLSIPSLIRVAWRVKHWVEPLLYRTLIIKPTIDPGDFFPSCTEEAFMEIVRIQKADFLRDSVRNLMVCSVSVQTAQTIASACPNVENLLVLCNNLGGRYEPQAVNIVQLKHLYCDRDQIFEITRLELFRHSSFRQITHLELFSGLRGNEWTGLVELSQLTHLALNRITSLRVCTPILEALKSLRALVLLCRHPEWPRPELVHLADDTRFVMMQVDSYIENWQQGVLTGDDYWTSVDQFIADRTSGKIHQRRYFLGDMDTLTG